MNRNTLVIAALALVALGLAACTIPTEYQAEMGQSLSIVMGLDGPMPDVGSLIHTVSQQPGVESSNMQVKSDGTSTRVDLALWGRDLDESALIEKLREEHEFLAGAEFIVEPLTVEVEGPLYERIGHDLFGIDFEIEVEGQTEEEIRASILEQMAAAGIEGDVQVQLEQLGDEQQVEIIIEAECEPE